MHWSKIIQRLAKIILFYVLNEREILRCKVANSKKRKKKKKRKRKENFLNVTT